MPVKHNAQKKLTKLLLFYELSKFFLCFLKKSLINEKITVYLMLYSHPQ